MARAYWITWYRDIKDLSAPAKYAELAGPVIRSHGGHFLVRGMSSQAPEGSNERGVVVQFESLQQAHAAYQSSEYQAALAVLGDTAVREVRLFEGAE